MLHNLCVCYLLMVLLRTAKVHVLMWLEIQRIKKNITFSLLHTLISGMLRWWAKDSLCYTWTMNALIGMVIASTRRQTVNAWLMCLLTMWKKVVARDWVWKFRNCLNASVLTSSPCKTTLLTLTRWQMTQRRPLYSIQGLRRNSHVPSTTLSVMRMVV